jgi:hypothetical protein
MTTTPTPEPIIYTVELPLDENGSALQYVPHSVFGLTSVKVLNGEPGATVTYVPDPHGPDSMILWVQGAAPGDNVVIPGTTVEVELVYAPA